MENAFDLEVPFDLLILRGAPGVGKSTLARNLRPHIPHGFLIEVDALRGMWHGVRWEEGEEHRAALRGTATLAINYLANGWRPGVVVDQLRGDDLDYLLSLLSDFSGRVHICTLLANEESLRRNMVGRRKDGVRDPVIASAIDSSLRGESLRPGEYRVGVDALEKDSLPSAVRLSRQFSEL